MPTAKQAAMTMSRVLHVPGGRMIFAADALGRAGHWPRSKGLPIELDACQTALLLLSGLLGTQGTQPDRVRLYADLADEAGSLGDAIANMLERPAGFVRLQIDVARPAALLVTENATRHFGDGDFARSAILSADALSRLLVHLRAAPVLRAGRPTNRMTNARFAY